MEIFQFLASLPPAIFKNINATLIAIFRLTETYSEYSEYELIMNDLQEYFTMLHFANV